MKTNTLVILLIALVHISCSSDVSTEQEVKSSVNENIISPDEQQLLSTNYQYDTDWENIKKAILSHDLVTLQAYVNEDNVDPLELLSSCQSDYILNKLTLNSFDDLVVEYIEDEVYLVFYASGAGTIAIYLYQGEKNLYVDYYIIGG
jgi:PBP1b-binding outer membrane lipoprotein LpoB